MEKHIMDELTIPSSTKNSFRLSGLAWVEKSASIMYLGRINRKSVVSSNIKFKKIIIWASSWENNPVLKIMR